VFDDTGLDQDGTDLDDQYGAHGVGSDTVAYAYTYSLDARGYGVHCGLVDGADSVAFLSELHTGNWKRCRLGSHAHVQ